MDESFLIEMGKRIQEKRKSLRLSQEELAERADISKQTVSRAENGQREMGARNVVRLARALQMSADYLLAGEYTYADAAIMNQKIAGLTDRQFRFLEEYIRNYIQLCKEDSV